MTRRFSDPFGQKICSTCLKVFPATKEYFHVNKRSKDGLTRVCKPCDNARRSSKEKAKAYHNIQRRCIICQTAFYASRSAINKFKNGGTYCSRTCFVPNFLKLGRAGISWQGARKGEGNPNCKYSINIVKQVKQQLKDKIKPKIISQNCFVPYSWVINIKNNHSWAHVIV